LAKDTNQRWKAQKYYEAGFEVAKFSHNVFKIKKI